MLRGPPQICGRLFEYLCPDQHSVAVLARMRSFELLLSTVMKISFVHCIQLNMLLSSPFIPEDGDRAMFETSCSYSILCIALRFGDRFGSRLQAHFFQNMTAHDDNLHHAFPPFF